MLIPAIIENRYTHIQYIQQDNGYDVVYCPLDAFTTAKITAQQSEAIVEAIKAVRMGEIPYVDLNKILNIMPTPLRRVLSFTRRLQKRSEGGYGSTGK